MRRVTNGTTAPQPEEERDRLVALLQSVGEHRASRLLHVSRLAIMRAVAGFPIHYGTAVALREGLRSLCGDAA